MKFRPVVLKHLRATWVRTAGTVVAMALSVFLFCTLQSVLAHFDGFIASRSPRRLVTRNAVSIISAIPLTARGPDRARARRQARGGHHRLRGSAADPQGRQGGSG